MSNFVLIGQVPGIDGRQDSSDHIRSLHNKVVLGAIVDESHHRHFFVDPEAPKAAYSTLDAGVEVFEVPSQVRLLSILLVFEWLAGDPEEVRWLMCSDKSSIIRIVLYGRSEGFPKRWYPLWKRFPVYLAQGFGHGYGLAMKKKKQVLKALEMSIDIETNRKHVLIKVPRSCLRSAG